MRIIISPAKQMRVDTDSFACKELPVFMDRTEVLMKWIQSLSYEEQKKLWVCNDKIARQNAERFAHMDLHKNLTPALLAYDGIQYTYMAPVVFEDGQYDYVQEHLRILSGFYGVVRPMDGVVPYRLEMQAKAAVSGHKNLYDFWGDSLYQKVIGESRIIINLASKEYSKCIEKYLQPDDRYITCIFGELEGDKVVQKGVYAKMARGEMVRFMAGIHAETPEQMKDFNWSGYHFDDDRSSDQEYIFIRTTIPGKGSLSLCVDMRTRDNMHIRELRADETELLKDFLYEAIFIPEGVEPPDKSIIYQPELSLYYEDFGSGSADNCLVAETDGKVVGAVWTRIMNDYGHVADDTPSFAISLYREYRGKGIGTEMMRKMLTLLAEQGWKQASLAVQKVNYAVRMYEAVGFRIVDENAEEYIMVRKL